MDTIPHELGEYGISERGYGHIEVFQLQVQFLYLKNGDNSPANKGWRK